MNILKKNNHESNSIENRNSVSSREKFDSVGKPCQPSKSGGFSSARGTEIPISNESLKNAERLFAEVNETYEIPKPKVTPAICGFSSASGKKVVISNVALQNAKKIFQDEDLIGSGEVNIPEFPTRNECGEDMAGPSSKSKPGSKRQLGHEETGQQPGRSKRFKGEDKFPEGDELFEVRYEAKLVMLLFTIVPNSKEMVLQMDTQYLKDIHFLTTESSPTTTEDKLLKEPGNRKLLALESNEIDL
jgi:hypothetical protein